MDNIEKVFVANGFDRKKVRKYMKRKNRQREERPEIKGAVSIPYVKGVSEEYKRIMTKHGIMTAMKSGRKVKVLHNKAKTPLGDKRKDCVYEINCGCQECVYIGQTGARWEERRKQHMSNIRVTEQELYSAGEMDIKRARDRMEGPSGKLYAHAAQDCNQGIDWATSGPLKFERKEKQRKIKESIETYKMELKGKRTLNICEDLDIKWKSLIEKRYERRRNGSQT